MRLFQLYRLRDSASGFHAVARLYHSHLRLTVSSIRDRCLFGMLLLATACGPSRLAPSKLTIAAAADLQFALEDLARQFHAAHPQIETQIVYGSSGNFFEQIRNQALLSILFLSADLEYPLPARAAGLAARDSVFTYAVGRLAV